MLQVRRRLSASSTKSFRMGDDVQEKREFLKKFIEKIIVKNEGIEIAYYAPQR